MPTPLVHAPPVVTALRHAASAPDAVAIVDGASGESLSRAELALRSLELATGLRARGIGRGDIVAVRIPNRAWWPVVALGIWRVGAAAALLSPLWTADELGRVLARVGPRLAIASGESVAAVRAGLAAAGLGVEVVVDGGGDDGATPLEWLLEPGDGSPFAEPRLAPDDLAVLPFSSGTSGLPKGVRLTHGNLSALSMQLAVAVDLRADSVSLAGAPFFHAMGLGLSLCAPLRLGARIVTLPAPDRRRALELVAEESVTHLTLPPPIVAELAADPGVADHDVGTLELVATGGAHVPASVQLRAGERLGCAVRQGYGMTESVAIAGPMGGRSDPATVGWLAPGVQARLVDPGSGSDAAPGEPGELWVRGPQVMDGYYDDPDATAATITADGWLRTGDLVTIRADGQLVIGDRLKELIKVRGAAVAPAELELVLREHPSVRDAAVVGRPDAEYGEVPIGRVVLERSATPDELLSFAHARVADYKYLHELRIVDELPRSPTGKLQRRVLREDERRLSAAPGSA